MRSRVVGIILAVFLQTTGCKPKDQQSADKSVEAVQTGDFSQRHGAACGPGALLTDSVDQALKKGREAIPSGFQFLYADVSSIQDVNGVAQRCYKILNREKDEAGLKVKLALSDIQGCWRVDGGSKPKVEIFLERETSKIYDNVLTMATYGLVDLYFDDVLGKTFDRLTSEQMQGISKTDAQLIELLKTFRSARETLTSAVIKDLKANGNKQALQRYREIFGDGYETSPFLANMFVAELTDAYYCSPDTRKGFLNAGFTNAAPAYKDVAELFGKAWWER